MQTEGWKVRREAAVIYGKMDDPVEGWRAGGGDKVDIGENRGRLGCGLKGELSGQGSRARRTVRAQHVHGHFISIVSFSA